MKGLFVLLVKNKKLPRNSVIALAIIAMLVAPITMPRQASADRYDDQIRALQSQASALQAQADKLRAQANTLQNKLQELATQKAGVQAQIDLSQAQYNQLQQQIIDTQARIVNNKKALGETIADLYVDDTISPLELLASSSGITDYVDKQAYRSSIRDNLTSTINEIKQLKVKLEKDKAATQEVLDKQTAQKNSLTALEAEQQAVLEKTKGEEAAYQQQVADARAQLEDVSAKQRAYYQSLLSSPGGGSSGVVGSFQYRNWGGNQGCSGGYPYCGPQDSMVDPWGLYNRECVSYVAWALVNRFGKYVGHFSGEGNAYEWPSSAPRYSGAVRVYDPQPGDAVVLPADGSFAPIGHLMIVESRPDATGWMRVSQYNYYGSGQYSTMDIKNSGIVLLRFPSR